MIGFGAHTAANEREFRSPSLSTPLNQIAWIGIRQGNRNNRAIRETMEYRVAENSDNDLPFAILLLCSACPGAFVSDLGVF